LQPGRPAYRLLRTDELPGEDNMNAACISVSLLTLLAGVADPAIAGSGRSISNVNGGVTASEGEAYDSVTTVNGDVRLGRGASAEEAKSVNGEVVLDEDAKVGNVSTVNGSLRLGEGASVMHEASTVNGGVQLAKRAHVGGGVATVSGEIELDGAEVTGALSTYNGDIELSGGAKVLGGIHIKKSKGWSWDSEHGRPPQVHICSTCVVEGELRFDRPVELRIDPGAKIGKVIGENVTRR
jgi:hypothetical protein